MRLLWPMLLLLGANCGGAANSRQLAETKIAPETVRDNEIKPPPGPEYPPRPGLEELGKVGLKCFNRALRHDAVFGKGGVMIVRWSADANGDLLSLDFVRNSFGDWEIDDAGQTMPACIAKQVERSTVRWSRSGTAPLRFSPVDTPQSQPTSRPASQL